jgi:BirA family biotin operon repressor/biotin-[acetyl-CoA-carboxylase] ligase
MDAARQEAQKGAAEGTIIVVEKQTAGRGRVKRAWISPKGCIAFSVILYPSIAHLPYLIMIVSLAVVRSIKEVTGLKPEIKWPNDILINGKKVCGILIENEIKGARVEYANIGIGINVNLNVADFSEIMSFATSLSDELGREVSRLDMIRHVLIEIEKLYTALQAGKSVFEEWRDCLTTLGKRVQVSAGEIKYKGIAESVDRDGSLLLRLEDGSLVRIVAGDVRLRDKE